MLKNLSIFLFIVMLCNGCGKNNDTGSAHEGVSIYYTDSSGSVLFDEGVDGLNGYWKDSVLVYDLNNGVKTLLTCFEAPDDTVAYNSPTGRMGYQFDNTLGYIRVHVCPNTDITNRYSTTLIHLKRGVDDTLIVHITGNSISPSADMDSIWYNGQLKYFQASIDAIGVMK